MCTYSRWVSERWCTALWKGWCFRAESAAESCVREEVEARNPKASKKVPVHRQDRNRWPCRRVLKDFNNAFPDVALRSLEIRAGTTPHCGMWRENDLRHKVNKVGKGEGLCLPLPLRCRSFCRRADSRALRDSHAVCAKVMSQACALEGLELSHRDSHWQLSPPAGAV